MTGTLPLILSQEPVTRGLLTRMKESRPSVAVVYATAFGEVAYFGGRPVNRGERGYSIRYEVDISDHRRTARLDSSPLPSRGDAYFFHCAVDVGFRVTDPAAIVKRNVTDGLTVVYGYLIDAFRPITRGYDIGEATAAEQAVNLRFQHPVALEEGITIYRCRARLLPDRAASDYLRSLEAAGRSLAVGRAEHQVAVASTRHTQELAEIEQAGRLEAERRELGALREPVDLQGLIRTHLAKHPGDTAYVTQLLLAYEQARQEHQGNEDKRWLDLVKYMVDKDIIQAVDVEQFRRQALGKVEQVALPAPAADSAAAWDRPLPVLSLAAEPASPAGPAQAPTVIPAYLVIGESAAEGGYLQALEAALQALPGSLATQPEVLAAVRLAILGFAGDVAARMPVNTITADTMLPPLIARPGASLTSVFAFLRGHIPQDMERLKSRHPVVIRPTVYLLCATAPDPEPGWEAALEQILDRGSFPYAPNVIACGAGGMPAWVLESIAAKPGCHAFTADPGAPLAQAARQYAAFVQRELAAHVQGRISGRAEVISAPPEGFRAVRADVPPESPAGIR